MEFQALLDAATEARTRAYAPYSNFTVGAALLSQDGRVFIGCNVENISFGLTICAERAAVSASVSAGCVVFERCVIVADTTEPVSPCGACRQVLAEFSESMEIISATIAGKTATWNLMELLPRAKVGILDVPHGTL